MNEENIDCEDAYWENDDPNADVYVEDEGDKGKMACPGCFTLNEPGNHFCEQCGKPLTSIAMCDPMGSIYGEGMRFAIR